MADKEDPDPSTSEPTELPAQPQSVPESTTVPRDTEPKGNNVSAFDIDLLSQPIFEQVCAPKMRATVSKETLIGAVRSLLPAEVTSEFTDDNIETILKFGLGQGATDNLSLVVTSAKFLGDAHRAKVAKIPYSADPREAGFKRRANADGNAANLGNTEEFDA